MSTTTPIKGQSAITIPSKDTISPVSIADTPAARAIALGRPAALVGLLFLRLSALVEDPVSTLYTALPVVAAIQCAYVVQCLPVAGAPLVKTSKKLRPGEKKRTEAGGPNLAVAVVLSFAFTIIATPAIHVLFILFGAPFLDHVSRTLLCSAHFSLLAVFPIIWARGAEREALMAVAGAYAPLDETMGGLLGAVVGAWLGAVPIPLDWDREWQKWPVTIVVGMYLGQAVGSKVAGTLVYGKRMVFAEEPEEKEE